MQTMYAKPFMSITELTSVGLSRDYLKNLSRINGAPVIKTLGGGKIYFITNKLDDFMRKITEKSLQR